MKSLHLKLFISLMVLVLIVNLNCDDNPTAPNLAPIVIIVTPLDNTSALAGSSLWYTAKVVDPERGKLNDSSLVWTSSIDGFLGFGETLYFRHMVPNIHIITLTATDGRGDVGSDSVIVNILPNSEPVASIISPADSSIFMWGDSVVFEGLATDLEDGTMSGSQLTWRSNNSWMGEGNSITVKHLSLDKYVITLTARDKAGFIGIDTIYIEVKTDSLPVVNITEPNDSLVSGLGDSITFSGSAYDFEDGELTGDSLVWMSDIDGQIGTGTTFSTSSLSENIHHISITYTDSDSNIVSDTVIVIVTSSWAKVINEGQIVGGNAIYRAIDGGYICAGYKQNDFEIFNDGYLFKIDSLGNILWENTFGGSIMESFVSLIHTSDNGYLAVGTSNSYGGEVNYIYLVQIDINGNLVWENHYGGTNFDAGRDICQATDGGYIISGYTTSFGVDSSDVYLIKIDEVGNLVWEKTFGGTGNDHGTDVVSSMDGGYLITGNTSSTGNGASDVYLVKTDVAGNLLWEKTFGGNNSDYGTSLIRTSDGGYIVLGLTKSFGDDEGDVYLFKIDLNGNLEWEKTYGSTEMDYCYSIRETSGGDYLITGKTYPIGSNASDVYLLKVDVNGNLIMDKQYGGNESEWGSDVIETADGRYLIIGTTYSFGRGIYLLYPDADGNVYMKD